jgi:ubiquinone/menaquinone biosynthesis C-methylase UbiE
MFLSRLLAGELRHPSGIVGKVILGPLWNRRNVALNDAAFDCLALDAHDRVLEVGFGGGYLLGRMAEAVTDGFLAGVDVSPAMVAACQKRFGELIHAGRLDLRCASAESLPYPAAHFSRVCSVNSIFYWPDAPRAFAECWRVLVDGGLLVVCFTCRGSLERKRFARHVALYEADDVERMMAAAGFGAMQTIQGADRHREFVCAVGKK